MNDLILICCHKYKNQNFGEKKNSIMPTLLSPHPKLKLCENWSYFQKTFTGFLFCMFSCFSSTVWLAPNSSEYISLECLQIKPMLCLLCHIAKRDVFINWIIYISSHYFFLKLSSETRTSLPMCWR